MFKRKGLFSTTGHSAVMAAAVSAVVLTSIGPAPSLAGPAVSGKNQDATAIRSTDFSGRRRVYRGGNGGTAAAAAFAAIVGTGIAIAASQNRRDYYDDYDGGGPAYYGGGPVYYGGGPYYGGYGGYRSGVPYVNGHPLAGW